MLLTSATHADSVLTVGPASVDMGSEIRRPGEICVVTITAIMEHGRTVVVDDVETRASKLSPDVKIYSEKTRNPGARKFSRHISLLMHLPGRTKPVNVKVFERKVQATGIKSDECVPAIIWLFDRIG